MTRLKAGLIALVVATASATILTAYSKPNTYQPFTLVYDPTTGTPVIKDPGRITFASQIDYSPHSWIIKRAIDLLVRDGYTTEAALANKYLLPMLEGVTFNDVWGDADMAGASVLDYYVPYQSDGGFGCNLHYWPFIGLYKNCTESFASNAFYGYGNAAEEAQFRYDYAKRIYAGLWGQDSRDTMAGWVEDTLFGQDDPQDGNWASGTSDIDGKASKFGAEPVTVFLDMLNHSSAAVVFPDQNEDALSTIYVPSDEVIYWGRDWLKHQFSGDADTIEAYNGYDGHGSAVYAAWTLDASGHCNTGFDCAAPMLVRLGATSKAHAFFQLGWAIHLLEDVTTPVHTISSSIETGEVHNDIEKEADAVLSLPVSVNAGEVKGLLPTDDAASFAAVYDWPIPACTPDGAGGCGPSNYPLPACTALAINPLDAGYYQPRWWAPDLALLPGEGIAHSYVRQSATMTNQFMHYIGCINTENQDNWSSMGFFTGFGLDLAIKTTAGLIREFIEESDRTPPAITVTQPVAGSYVHTATLTLEYSATDDETGVKSVTATIDGASMLGGEDLTDGQMISLLNLPAGTHTFKVQAIDNARPTANASTASVRFDIIVTPESLATEVNTFVGTGQITSGDDGNSLLQQLAAAAQARASGQCGTAANIYQAFIAHVEAQTGKTIDPAAAAILVADAQYLMAHC